ncbi:MAG: hypothetical protein ACLFT4_00155 [Bacteroidales bacterium]
MKIDREKIVKVTGLKPIYKRHNKPFHMAPIEENGTFLYGMEPYGEIFETFSEDERNYAKRELMTLRDGESLHLNRNKDFAKYTRALMYPNIALERSEINLDTHDVFLNDIFNEANEEIKGIDMTYKALDYVANKLTPKTEKALYLFLGKTGYDHTSEIIRKNILKKSCMDEPKKVVKFFENESEIRYEILARQLIYDNIVAETSSGYEFRGNLVSSSLSGLVERIATDAKLRNALITASTEGRTEEPRNIDERKKEAQNREAVLQKKLEYMKHSGGKTYTGKETVEDIEVAINALIDENIKGKAEERLEKQKEEFRSKYGDATKAKLRQVANGRKLPKEEWDDLEKDDLYEYLFNKQFGK